MSETQVFLGVGSNVDRQRHIAEALDALSELLSGMRCSPVYECDPVGFSGFPFYNLVVMGLYSGTLTRLAEALKQLEERFGRRPNEPRFSDKRLDVDILLFGDRAGLCEGIRLPRPDLLAQAYVLKPLSDLQPTHQVPGTDKTVAELWSSYCLRHPVSLSRVAFEWRGVRL